MRRSGYRSGGRWDGDLRSVTAPGAVLATRSSVRGCPRLLAALFVGFALLVTVLAPIPGRAADPGFGGDVRAERTTRAVGFLQRLQNPDGGIPSQREGRSDPAVSVWAGLAVAAAGISPRDQTVRRGTSLWGYLRAHADELTTTDDLARLVLVARAAKADPARIGRVRPLATLAERQTADGAFAAGAGGGAASVASTAWAALALPGGDVRIRSLRWLGAQRNADGAWPEAVGGASDARATGLVMQVLDGEAGDARTMEALRGLQQRRSGGIARSSGGDPDLLATALVIQGAVATDANRTLLSYGPYDPTQFLWNRQSGSGALGSVLATAQVGAALAERPFPLRPVASKGPTNTGIPVAEDEPDPPVEEPPADEPDDDPAPSTGGSSDPSAVVGGSSDGRPGGTDATTGGSGAKGDVAGAGPPEKAPVPKSGKTDKAPAAPATGDGTVSGTVVGATTGAPEAATGGGGGDDDGGDRRVTLGLAGLLLVFALLGVWLERRPSRPLPDLSALPS